MAKSDPMKNSRFLLSQLGMLDNKLKDEITGFRNNSIIELKTCSVKNSLCTVET